MSAAVDTGRDSWVAAFDEELSNDDWAPSERQFGLMVKKLLISEQDPAVIARNIDDFSTKGYLELDPHLKTQVDQGLSLFVDEFYDHVLLLARLIPYDSHDQEKLVEVLAELQKLPREVRIENKDCLVWARDPTLGHKLEQEWNKGYPTAENKQAISATQFQEKCDMWVNLSTFVGRCTAKGLLDRDQYVYKQPVTEVPNGLEKTLVDDQERECKVTVAAKYLLLIGPHLRNICLNEPKTGLTPESWKRWQAKLEEIAATGDGNPRLASLAKQAHAYMSSLP